MHEDELDDDERGDVDELVLNCWDWVGAWDWDADWCWADCWLW